MATILATSLNGSGSRTVNVTVLGASDTFIYTGFKNPLLILNNVSGGALTPLITGDGSTTVQVSGVGSVDVSGGYLVPSIGVGETVAIPLNSIDAYLLGTIALTGGDLIEAQLLES